MHRTPTLLFSLTVCAGSMAQPLIDLDNMPIVGDNIPIGICSDPVDSAALNTATGAMQIWDFSNLTEQVQEQFQFVDPVGSLWENDFPSSTLCGISWDGSHAYYTTGASGLEQNGACVILPGPPPEDTSKIVLGGSSEVVMELPLSFGDGHVDAFSGTFNAGPFTGTTNGTIDFVADGHGTLILPNATYPNTVRYHFDRTQNNTIFGNTNQTSKEQWAWVSADHRFWLLLMEINDDGFGTSQQVWYDKNPALAGPTAVADAASTEPSVFPVPVEAGSDAYVRGLADGQRIDLLDATGRIIRKLPYGSTIIPTEGLAPAIYLLRSSDRNGRTVGTSRLIVR